MHDIAFAFLSILFEGAPYILLGTLISGFLDVLLPPKLIERILPKQRFLAVVFSGLLGIILPVCECAVVPVIRRLVKKGLPVSCGITYMLAAPIVNPITALSTFKAFSGQDPWLLTSSRLGMGFIIAVLAGIAVSFFRPSSILKASVLGTKKEEAHEHSCCHEEHTHDDTCDHHHSEHHHKSPNKLVTALRSSMNDFVDVGTYFVIGVAITALFNTGVAPGMELLDQLAEQQLASPFVLMGLAFILSLCSTSDAFIAATLDRFTQGAKLAFLVLGPMLDVKLVFLYSTIFQKKALSILAVGLVIAIGLLSIIWQFQFGPTN